MHVVVCLKAVWRDPSSVEVEDGAITSRGASLRFNQADVPVLLRAIELKRTGGASVTAVTAGPRAAREILYTATALGADRTLIVEASPHDAAGTASFLAAAIADLSPDLVLTGSEAYDTLEGVVGGVLASRMGLPYCFGVVDLDVQGSPGRVRVTKEIGGGSRQIVDVILPAVLSMQLEPAQAPYVPIAKSIMAKRRAISSMQPSRSDTGRAAWRPLSVRPNAPNVERRTIEGSPSDIAERILSLVKAS